MTDIPQSASLTEPQRDLLTTILAQYAPSLPDSERELLMAHLETFVASVSDANDISADAESWIPVTRRYPQPKERVLIFVPRWGVLTIGWLTKANPTRWELITMPGKTTDFVSHWQPLPTGPLQAPPR